MGATSSQNYYKNIFNQGKDEDLKNTKNSKGKNRDKEMGVSP